MPDSFDFDSILAALAQTGRALVELTLRVLSVLLFVGIGWLMMRAIRPLVRKLLYRENRPSRTLVLSGLFTTLWMLLATLLAITFAFPSVEVVNILGGLGVISIAVGFAFKDVLENLLAGVLLVLRDPFRRDDQIRTGSFEGTVEGLTIRETLLRTYDGRRVLIPNAQVYTQPLEVLTHFPWRRVTVQLNYDLAVAPEQLRSTFLPVLLSLQHEGSPRPEVMIVDGDGKISCELHVWAPSHRREQNAAVDETVAAVLDASHAAGLKAFSPALVMDAGGDLAT